MKIIIDSDIPYINGVFEPYAEVKYLKGTAIRPADVCHADVLIVRTRTHCDEALLAESTVRMIATATIGLDHIDLEYCSASGIEVRSAAGCNARAVAQWVFAAIDACKAKGVLGIVGVGNVGREVEAMAARRSVEVLRCDPVRAARGEAGFIELAELLQQSDIVTVHVPLLPSTQSMINDHFLSMMRHGSLLLNSSRGEVADEQAIINNRSIRCAIDVWRNEPNINLQLLDRASIATAHIAGYSARGKARATQMVVCDVANFMGITKLKAWQPVGEFAIEEPENFDISAADKAFRGAPELFESQRIIRA